MAAAPLEEVPIANESFESDGGWSDLSTSDNELHAPPDGSRYATRRGSDGWTAQRVAASIEPGKRYTLRLWARSATTESNRPRTARASTTRANVELVAGDVPVASTEAVVSPAELQGAARDTPNDDGANVWLEDEWRVEAGDYLLSQPAAADPLTGAWSRGVALSGMAHSPAFTPQGLRALYSTFYHDDCPGYDCLSRIDKRTLLGPPPAYRVRPTGHDIAGPVYETILSHRDNGGAAAWVIDPYVYYEAETQRLWMVWGGWQIWITELDPASGRIIDPASGTTPPSTEFSSHAAGVHTRILEFSEGAPGWWRGDAYTRRGYQEGASLLRRNGFWYACASYGDMDEDYTIRCCRTPFRPDARDTGVRGPYTDKLGRRCDAFDADTRTFGASMLLGPDGDQLVPGHPHVWSESNGTVTYLGYDFRRGDVNGVDTMGIRRLHFHADWPTIWTPLSLTFDTPHAITIFPIGAPLTVRFRNSGEGVAAFDGLSLNREALQAPPPLPPRLPPRPPPSTPPPLLPPPPLPPRPQSPQSPRSPPPLLPPLTPPAPPPPTPLSPVRASFVIDAPELIPGIASASLFILLGVMRCCACRKRRAADTSTHASTAPPPPPPPPKAKPKGAKRPKRPKRQAFECVASSAREIYVV